MAEQPDGVKLDFQIVTVREDSAAKEEGEEPSVTSELVNVEVPVPRPQEWGRLYLCPTTGVMFFTHDSFDTDRRCTILRFH